MKLTSQSHNSAVNLLKMQIHLHTSTSSDGVGLTVLTFSCSLGLDELPAQSRKRDRSHLPRDLKTFS